MNSGQIVKSSRLHLSFIIFIILCLELSAAPVRTSQDSLSIKIGQMLMVGFPLDTPFLDTLYSDIRDHHLGGVVLFEYNIHNPIQIAHLTGQLYPLSKSSLFIAVDQEGGHVTRFNQRNGYQQIPTAFQLGTAINSRDSTQSAAATMAEWLYESGVNLTLAPVVDLNINPESPAIGAWERSYSPDPDTVIQHAQWFISEFRNRNILTCLKHFPGHGNAADDSHLGITRISETWSERELLPYRRLIGKGYDEFIMAGHLLHEKVDSLYPASLSPVFIKQILRDSLGFRGVVISDDLFMEAITEQYGFEETVERAVNAGIDILVFRINEIEERALVPFVVSTIRKKVEEGVIPVQTIDDSYRRIQRLKNRITEFGVKTPSALPDLFSVFSMPDVSSDSSGLFLHIRRNAPVDLTIKDIGGRRLGSYSSSMLAAGIHEINLSDCDIRPGLYIVQLRIYEFEFSRKLSVLHPVSLPRE